MSPITQDLTNQIYKVAFDGASLANECEKGVVNEWRIWWVQAETVVGFLNGYEKTGRFGISRRGEEGMAVYQRPFD